MDDNTKPSLYEIAYKRAIEIYGPNYDKDELETYIDFYVNAFSSFQ